MTGKLLNIYTEQQDIACETCRKGNEVIFIKTSDIKRYIIMKCF